MFPHIMTGTEVKPYYDYSFIPFFCILLIIITIIIIVAIRKRAFVEFNVTL